mgnify:CR=1 FL=1
MGPFNRIVFTVVGRVVCESNGDAVLVYEVHGPLDELCASAAVFGTIVLVDHQPRRAVVCLPFWPMILYTIPHVIARYLRLSKRDKKVIVLWQQYAEGRKGTLIPEVMIGCLYLNPAITASGEGAKLNRGLGIHGQTQVSLRLVRFTVDLPKLFKYGICFGDLLQRFVFFTFRSR